MKRLTITLSEDEVGKIRTAFARYLDELGMADMDDTAARKLVRKITAEAEKKWNVSYRQQF